MSSDFDRDSVPERLPPLVPPRASVSPPTGSRASRRWLAPGLFLATCCSTTFCGAFLGPANEPAFEIFARWFGSGFWSNLLGTLVSGLPYAMAAMAFFLAHEMGHYVACRVHRLDASLPYFIPAPTLFGTLGAVIRIRSPFRSRTALFDVGIAGPLAGLVVALPAVVWGILAAEVVDSGGSGPGLYFGDSLLTLLLQHLLRPETIGRELLIGPVYVAGWLGLLATGMNLCPAGQLDGGHILYAVSPRWHGPISLATGIFFVTLVVTRFVLYREWSAWIVWALIVLLLCRRHPPVGRAEQSLDPVRSALAIVAFAFFVLVFMPNPLQQILP